MSEATAGKQLNAQGLIWGFMIAIGAIFGGYFLVEDARNLAIAILGVGWLATLPYHTKLSIYLAYGSLGSAFVIGFLPGRPMLWELAAIMGWSGMLVTMLLRREHPEMFAILRRNWLIVLGAIGYSLVLLVTMKYRGFGLRVFGDGGAMGGRYYIQQLICVIFPFALAAFPMDERRLNLLFWIQCALSVSFLISEVALRLGIPASTGIFLFLDLSTDSMNFEQQAQNFGIERFQSLAAIGSAGIYFLAARFGTSSFFDHRSARTLPLLLLALGVGALSGHRSLLILTIASLLFVAYAQRAFTVPRLILLLFILAIVLPVIYMIGRDLPLSVQRTVSFLPGIDLHNAAVQDASNTWRMRVLLRDLGIDLIPDYLWLGRGLGFTGPLDAMSAVDPTGVEWHLFIGRFYNGLVGLMVNTGLFGTLTMLAFLLGGSVCAGRIMAVVRRWDWQDPFACLAATIAGMWFARVLFWLFLHGDSEWAMKTFAPHAAFLMACEFHLRRRVREVSARQLEEESA